jgi:hypothetical protein
MSSVNSGPPNIRERLDELLSSSGPGTDARLQENLSLLRSVLSGNSGVIFPSDVARAAVASLEKVCFIFQINFCTLRSFLIPGCTASYRERHRIRCRP